MSVSPDSETAINQVTRTTQIIVGALITGVTSFLLIVVGMIHFAGFSLQGAPATAPGQAAGPNPPGAGAGAGAANPVNNPAAGQQPAPAPAPSIPILTYMSAGLAVILLPLSFILPNIVATQSLRSAAAGKPDNNPSSTPSVGKAANPANAFQTSAIIGGALDESVAFFAGIAYLIEQNPIALVVAGVCLGALVARFPTRDRVERWIALQEEKLRFGSSG
jgi:hypothetical protein